MGLTSLVDRRRRGEMVEVWKNVHGKENVEKAKWFTMAADAAQRPTRQSSSPFALKPPEWKGVIRKNFFSNRVVSHSGTVSHCRFKAVQTLTLLKTLMIVFFRQ